MTGSPAMSRAVAWAVAAFRQAGVDEVRAEKYTIPLSWSEGATRLEVLMPAPFPMRLVSVGWAPPTPAAGLEANLVDIGEGGERSEEHTSELQSQSNLVCRLLLEKKKKKQ